MDEKKILDLLREQTDAITPPESLSPDAIEQKLLDRKKTIMISEEMNDKASVNRSNENMNQNGMGESEKEQPEK